MLMLFGKKKDPVALPADFLSRWTPAFQIYGSGVGGYTTDFNPASLKPSGTEAFVALDGHDTTGDGSIGNPYRSIARAITAGAVRIAIRGGHYGEGYNWRNGDTFRPSGDYYIYAYDGPGTVIITTGMGGLTWTPQTAPNDSVYSTNIGSASIRAIADLSAGASVRSGEYLVDGSTPLPVPYTLASDLADCQVTPSSYYISGSTLYVHTEDSRAPDSDMIVMNASNHVQPIPTETSQTLYFEGLEIWGDLALYASVSNPNTNRFICVDTAGRFAGQNIPTWNLDGFSECYFIRCQATDGIDGDGFNYASNTPASFPAPNVLELDCISRRHGTAINDNCTTGHNGANIIRLNGVYGSSTGPVIVDALGAYSVNLGCDISNASGSGFDGSLVQGGQTDAVFGNAKVWVGHCRFHGTGNYSLAQISGGEIYMFGTRPLIDAIGSTHGTITTI